MKKQKKQIHLIISDGSFENGFPAVIQIFEGGEYIQEVNRLPPFPEIPQCYQAWNEACQKLARIRVIIESADRVSDEEVQTTQEELRRNKENYIQAAEELEQSLNEWFDSNAFANLRGYILDHTNQEDDISLIVQTQNPYLRKLPWHIWRLFENRPKAEPTLSSDRFRKIKPRLIKTPVRILAILGDSRGINIERDKEILQKLPNAQVEILNQPTRKKLHEYLLSQSWDILFFAGHSCSDLQGNQGVIQINPREILSIHQLKSSLKRSINKDLKLAIFNSCDGLGIAKELADLNIPQVIVMREPVPDKVAQEFLKVFLKSFSQGNPLHTAVREGREYLEVMEGEFPRASWLPVIWQNPTAFDWVWPKTIELGKWILGGVVIGVLALSGIWYFNRPQQPEPLRLNEQLKVSKNEELDNELLSLGEKNLTPEYAFNNKQNCISNLKQKYDGIEYFKQGEFQPAVESFDTFVNQCSVDPEARIYLNNAKAALQGNPIQIAASVPIGGQVGAAQEMLRGVAQVQDEVNQDKGINGRLLQVMIANDDTSKDINLLDKATTVAQALTLDTENIDILGVIGHYTSDATLETGKIYQQDNLVVISPTSTAIRQQVKFTDNVFRTAPTDAVAAEKLVDYMDAQFYDKAAIVYESDSQYSQSFRLMFTDNIGKNDVVHECDLSNSGFRASQCVKDAFDKNADILALLPSSEPYSKTQYLIKQNENLPFENFSFGRPPLPLLGGDAMYAGKILQDGGKAVDGMVVAIPWHQDSNNLTESSKTFLEKAQQLWQTQSVNWRTASSYDATKALVEGLIQLGNQPTREDLKKVLSSPNFSVEGATGIVEFNSNGDRKMTAENQDELGMLVKVECDGKCKFEPLDINTNN